MELLSPAGSAEKLRYAYRYGADAAYIGLPLFSLRAQAENIDDGDLLAPEKIKAIKEAFSAAAAMPPPANPPPLAANTPTRAITTTATNATAALAANPRAGRRKLYCAINIFFHNDDLSALERALPRIAEYPFDGFIVSDMGAYEILRGRFPDSEFHVSTQANCTNWRTAKMYRDMGFSRIVPARELSLDEIKAIKDHVPGLEIEAFVHGAMCMAYSGRCFLSSWLAGRSANKGDCSHSCRWHYKILLEEEKRPGQLIPVEFGESAHGGYSLVMSSRDICMIDHLEDLRGAGVDSVKIEGRMRSLYYVALVTRAYRYALDHPGVENPFREDLFAVSHREYDTGFYFGREGMDTSATKAYRQTHLFTGSVEPPPPLFDSLGNPVDAEALSARFAQDGWTWPVYVDMKNTISVSEPLELLGPETKALRLDPGDYRFFDTDGNEPEQARHGKAWFFQAKSEKFAGTRETGGGTEAGAEPGPYWLLRADNARQNV